MMIIVKAWCLGSPVWPLIAVASNFASTSPPSLPIPNYILSRPERKYSTFAWNKTSLHFPFPIQRQSYFVFIWIGLDCMEWCWGWRPKTFPFLFVSATIVLNSIQTTEPAIRVWFFNIFILLNLFGANWLTAGSFHPWQNVHPGSPLELSFPRFFCRWSLERVKAGGCSSKSVFSLSPSQVPSHAMPPTMTIPPPITAMLPRGAPT